MSFSAHFLILARRPRKIAQPSSRINLAVIPPASVVRKVGSTSSEAMTEIDKCLKVALGL
jgi:hypothetical protein